MRVGDGVFEAVKVVDGHPFALTRHLERLAGSAEVLGLPRPDLEEVRRAVAAAVAARPLPLGRVRITYTGVDVPACADPAPPNLQVAAAPMKPWSGPARIVTVPWRRNERGPLAGHKATAYAENVIALAFANRHGASEGVFANTRGHLCEGTSSNVFYVVDGELRTPSLASGCLPGVSRALLLEWYGARETDEEVDVLDRAEEILLVSTTRDVQAVVRCDERELAAPGPITREAAAVWAERERADTDP